MPSPFSFGGLIGNITSPTSPAKTTAASKPPLSGRSYASTPRPPVVPNLNRPAAERGPNWSPASEYQEAANAARSGPMESNYQDWSRRAGELREQENMNRARPAQRPAPTGSNPALKLNTTVTPGNGQALSKQIPQMPPSPAAPAPSAGSWANQTNDPNMSQPPSQPQGPTMFQRMSNAYNAFRGATPGAAAMPAAPQQAQPSHIITTDNGRQFNTQTKTFLDGRPGGFAR
jgi:hypothetical protein